MVALLWPFPDSFFLLLVLEPVVKKNKKKVPPTLGELSVSDVTDDSVRLSWSIPSGASFDSFVIQYKDAKGRPQMLPVVGDSREATIPGLAPSRRYKFNFYGISDHKRFGPIAADVTTGQQKNLNVTIFFTGICFFSLILFFFSLESGSENLFTEFLLSLSKNWISRGSSSRIFFRAAAVFFLTGQQGVSFKPLYDRQKINR